MKKLLLFLALVTGINYNASAQIADGSIAPNFTFTDINGNTVKLHDLLNAGKYVAIDVSATWCGPCWQYHNMGVLDELYEKYDAPGSNQWKVLFIEADGSTNSADLHGTGSNTHGDWTHNAHYTIIDPAAGSALNIFNNGYNIQYFPTMILIGPNKKAYTSDLNNGSTFPSLTDWEAVAAAKFGFFPTSVSKANDKHTMSVYPNPATNTTTLSFNLSASANVKLNVVNMIGQVVDRKDLGALKAGNQSIPYSVSELPKGMYYFTISATNSSSMTMKVIVQ